MFASVGCGVSFRMRTEILKGVFLMKKTLFALFAVMLVLLMVACDDFAQLGYGNAPQYTEDGRQMVTLTINVGDNGTSRALIGTGTVAKDASTKYEVAFYDGSDYYRTELTSSGGTITVPEGSYAGANKAVMFAGTNTNTLLAVGVITANNGGGGVGDVTPTTTSVTFTLSPLTSEFKIDKGTGTFVVSDATYTSYPVFSITNGTTGIKGQFTFGGPTANFNGVKIGTWTVSSAADTAFAPYESAALPYITTAGATPGTDVLLSSTSGVFTFDISLGSVADKFSKIFIDVPVVAIDNIAGKTAGSNTITTTPPTWHINGGLTNANLDDGTTISGGAVVLKVGTPKMTITIAPPGW